MEEMGGGSAMLLLALFVLCFGVLLVVVLHWAISRFREKRRKGMPKGSQTDPRL